jgi:hypothetical protein
VELATYLLILALSILFSFNHRFLKSDKLFLLLYLFVSIFLSLVIRGAGFDSDIKTYALSMSSNSFSLYYLREPIVWLGQRLLFNVFYSEVVVFVFFDFIVLLFTYYALKNFKVPQYSYFALLSFFPFILGMQNVYRQWVAVVFVLLSLSFVYKSTSKRYISFLLAGLSHNVSGLFLSAFFLVSKRSFERFLGLVFLIMTPLIIIFSAETKSQTSSGRNLVLAYIVLMIVISVFMIISSRLKIRIYERKSYIVLGCSIFSTVATGMILSSTGSERTAMFSLVLLYPHLINFFEWHFKQKILFRFGVIVCGFFPLLFFGTSEFIL